MSLRFRLSLWYGSALALILALFAGTLYGVLASGLKDQVDRGLEEAASVAIRSLEQRFGPSLYFEDLSVHFPQLAVLDKFFQIYSPTGQVTIQSPNIRRADIPLSATALSAALSGQTTFESVRYPGESDLRLISVPIIYSGTLVNIVRVGTSLKPVEETLHRLLGLLLLAIPAALLVSLAGGWFLAGRALRPVEAVTQAAQRIAAGDLSQRLTVPTSADEIGRLASTFNDMIARLDTSFRQIRQFTGDASHELRTPLTVMRGETDLALRRPRSEDDYRAVLESNLDEIERMTRIVDELLFLSRADLGEIKLDADPVRLDLLAEEVQRQASVLGQDREIHVGIGTLSPAIVTGDELRLRELVLNLVDNAVKYSHPGGKVELGLIATATQATLSITDHGIGIAEEDRRRIFDRFYRADAARAHAQKGTGLGLSICRWIAEAHRGRIEVQSSPGQGSTFSLILPLAKAAS